jgi:hypothetical protein
VLIARRRDRLVLITHPEHARLVGVLAEHWGNADFAPPTRPAPFAHVATHHDDGWAELDRRPVHAETEQRPAHFLEVELLETIAPYGRGVDGIHAHDPYAGALASMHWGGLYSARWGLQEGPFVGHPAAQTVAAEQQARWATALGAAWGGAGQRAELEADAWRDYAILQALDLLSLALCTVDLAAPTDTTAAATPVAATLRGIDQPAGARTIPAVPTHPGQADAALTFSVTQPKVATLDPWPFAVAEVDLEIATRTLADHPYATAAEGQAAFAGAAVEPVAVRLADPAAA